MKNEHLDHAPIVESWLKEPTLLPPSDTARLTQLIHRTPQQRRWWQRDFTGRTQSMFSAFKLAAASIVLAVSGGFLLSTFASQQDDSEQLPAAVTSSPTAETASPVAETPSASPDAETPSAEPTSADAVLVMDAGTGETVGGFTQVGRLSTDSAPRSGEFMDLSVVGDRLVVRDAANDVATILYSSDGMAWSAASLPGNDPEVEDLAMTERGLLAAGSVKVDGEREARLWASSDGVEWSSVPAPPAKRIHQIVSSDSSSTIVRAGNQVWLSGDDGEWTKWNRVVNSSILDGPGGILVWQGGGQDLTVPTVVLHWDTPQSPLTEVTLPKPLQWDTAGQRSPDMGIDVFALDDQWVMIGSENKAPDSIGVSSDGLEWEDVPRPPGMAQDAVRWVAQVGDQVQAFGMLARDDGTPGAIWTWTMGEEVPEPETLSGSDSWIDTPVAWQGGYVATGYERRKNQFLTIWRMEADAAD